MADKASPATRSQAHRIMSPRWDLIRHILAGTEAMRAAGDQYTPRHQEESLLNYQDRVLSTVLVNVTELVSESLVGRVFKVPLAPQDDVPKPMLAQFDDVDLAGTGINPFCREWFEEGLNMGLSHVVVEMQQPTTQEGEVRTLADDQKEALRPYWYRVSPENVIAAYTARVNGREVLTHVRIAEHAVERQGFAEVNVLRIRVLEPDHWETWLPKDPEKQGEDDEWVMEAQGPNPLGFIPMVTFYTGTRDKVPFLCKPPLLDLAHLNVAHWNSTSDQRSILTVARFPILAASGIDADDVTKLKIGPREWLSSPDANGKWYYVEHSGRAIQAGERDLQRLEALMAAYGAQFLKSQPGTQSATERALNEAGTLSPLEAMGLDFQDCLQQVLALHAQWMNLGQGPNAGGLVKVEVDVSEQEVDQVALEALFRARVARDISRAAYIGVLKNRGVLPEDFDHAADLQQLADEPEFGMPERGVDANTKPGAPDKAQNDPIGNPTPKPGGNAQDTPGGNTIPSKPKGGQNLPSLTGNSRKSAIAGRKV